MSGIAWGSHNRDTEQEQGKVNVLNATLWDAMLDAMESVNASIVFGIGSGSESPALILSKNSGVSLSKIGLNRLAIGENHRLKFG